MRHLTMEGIRRAVKVLQKNCVMPVNGFYHGYVAFISLIDLIMSNKRPRATKLYRRSARAAAYVDALIKFKRYRSSKLYKSLRTQP